MLAGGASRRMGTDKALLVVDGQALARRAADALVGAGADPVLCVGGDREALEGLGLDVRADGHPGEGPLGGLLTAFDETTPPVVAVLACDLPRVTADSVRRVVEALEAAEGADGAVPVVDGRRQWLHAAYRRSALPVLSAAFTAGERSIERIGGRLSLVDVPDVDAATLVDADMPTDLTPFTGTLAPPSGDESEQL